MDDMHSLTVGKEVEDPRKPGPRNNLVHCFIRRDRKTSTFTLWQDPPSKAALEEGKSLVLAEENFAQQVGTEVNGASAMEDGKFLLAARKLQGLRSTEYIISPTPNDFKDSNIDVCGKLKSNFWNSKFSVYENKHPHMGAVPIVKPTSGRPISSSKVSPGGHAASVKVAAISYKVYGYRPASMECSLLTIPASIMECSVHTIPSLDSLESKSAVMDCCVEEFQSLSSPLLRKEGPLVLNSKIPYWNHKCGSYALRFDQRGRRVLLRSVKNYQLHGKNYQPLPAFTEPDLSSSNIGPLVLQFAKCGKNLYQMDYGYPLSAFQGFAIFLSRVDRKYSYLYLLWAL